MNYRQITTLAHTLTGNDPLRVVLQQKRYPNVDMKLVAQQLEGKAQASVKWPTLVHCRDFFYAPRLNREQSSSETTAHYKADIISQLRQKPSSLANGPFTIADLTGGMGIDSFTFAQSSPSFDVTYIEQDAELASITEYNRITLGIENMHCICDDCIAWIRQQTTTFDLIYIDPARRDNHGRKVAAFSDCTPNILEHKQLLLSHGRRLLIKASPMIDIDLAVFELGNVSDVYVVAVRNECKEVLFLCDIESSETVIHCIDLESSWSEPFCFTRDEEQKAETNPYTTTGNYLYEPHAALMKAGPYKLIGRQWKINQLSRNTHLYSSNTLQPDFPGRTWEILSETSLTRKAIGLNITGGKAHVITRNYPTDAATLQRQLGLKEGGELFVVATTIGSRKTGLICRSIQTTTVLENQAQP